MKRIKLFTHTDLDGVGCGIVAKMKYGNSVDVEHCDYHNINDKVKRFIKNDEHVQYDFIYVTDISLSEELAEMVEGNLRDKFKLLDHHDTSLWMNKYDWAEVAVEDKKLQIKTSGTMLLYNELFGNEKYLFNVNLKEFVMLVTKYDTWLWKELNDFKAKNLNDLLYIYGRENFYDIYLSKIINLSELMSPNEMLLLQLEEEKICRYVKEKNSEIKPIKIMNYNAGVVFAEQFVSQLGNELATLNSSYDFIIIINPSKSISLRGLRDDIHLGKVAEQFGGGGHPKAAGIPITEHIKNMFINNLLKSKGEM